jgi:catechol 2,3-dioxygenase-like lactoylglutathione lyase family enzyme
MSRVQLALRVSDLEASVGFYRSLFGAEPAKRRPGYANFAIAEPPLKLVLIEGEPDQPTGSTTSGSRSPPQRRFATPLRAWAPKA